MWDDRDPATITQMIPDMTLPVISFSAKNHEPILVHDGIPMIGSDTERNDHRDLPTYIAF